MPFRGLNPPETPSTVRDVTGAGSGLAGLPETRFGILGTDVRLRTDSAQIRSFFRHAYRWFPPDDDGETLEAVALLGSGVPSGPIALAGGRRMNLAGSPSPENQAFLFLLGAITDSVGGSLMLHGAAVSIGGAGVILAGPAFAGKSTLVVELMKRGALFMSDDAAPIDRKTGLLHSYPRAIGIRKSAGKERPAGSISGAAALELPHRWLVDPEALGARLPVPSCLPRFLFYLDPGGWATGRAGSEVRYEIALAAEPEGLRDELLRIGAREIEPRPARPFPLLSVTMPREGGTAAGLQDLQGRFRESILYLEEIRPPVPRPAGPPVLERVSVSSLLILIARDLLNRGEGSRLMKAHGGKAASLLFELGALLRGVNAYLVSAGSATDLAEAVTDIVRAGDAP